MKNQFFTLPYHPGKLLWGDPLNLSALHLVCVVSPGIPLTAGQMAEQLNSLHTLRALLVGAEKALDKAMPFCPADAEAVFVGEWLDEIAENNLAALNAGDKRDLTDVFFSREEFPGMTWRVLRRFSPGLWVCASDTGSVCNFYSSQVLGCNAETTR